MANDIFLEKVNEYVQKQNAAYHLRGLRILIYTYLAQSIQRVEVLGGETHRLNTVESHGESDIEILSSCSLLHNDSKELGSFMSTETNPDSPTKWTGYPGAFVMLAYERLSKQG